MLLSFCLEVTRAYCGLERVRFARLRRALWAFPEPPTHNLLLQTVYQTIGRLRFFFLTVDPATGRVLASCQRSDSAKLAFRPRFVRFGFFGMDGTGVLAGIVT